MRLTTWGATELLAQMTKDFATCSGQHFDVGDFEEVGESGVAATVTESDGYRFRVTVELLGKA